MKPAADPEVFIWDSRKLWNVAEMIKHVCSMLCALIQDLLSTQPVQVRLGVLVSESIFQRFRHLRPLQISREGIL